MDKCLTDSLKVCSLGKSGSNNAIPVKKGLYFENSRRSFCDMFQKC